MNYYEIKIKSTIDKELYDYAFNPQPWFPHYNFNVKPIPPDIIHRDNFFKWLHARYEFVHLHHMYSTDFYTFHASGTYDVCYV